MGRVESREGRTRLSRSRRRCRLHSRAWFLRLRLIIQVFQMLDEEDEREAACVVPFLLANILKIEAEISNFSSLHGFPQFLSHLSRSGKTFAFGVPALQHLMTDAAPPSKKKGKGGQGQISVLVVAPTRELAIQTQENLAKIGDPLGMGSICLYGGVSKYEQQSALRSSNPPIRIVVGTPGRVKDLASTEGSGLDLSKVSFLVLDEADRMLDKGFEPDIRFIIGLCKSREEGRKTSMFSATWPPAVRGLAETFMNNPVRVTVGSDELSANRRVEQIVEVLDDGRAKERKLDVFLKKVGAGPKGKNSKDKILIFALYKKVSVSASAKEEIIS